MPIPRVTIDSDKYHIYLKYYLRGEHYSPEMSHLRSGSTKVEWILDNYYWQQKKIKEEPGEIISRRFKTHYFVYEVFVESRNSNNELEFLELECSHYVKYKEIWRCFYKPEQILNLDLNPPVEDIVEYPGNFFAFPYNTLSDLIKNNLILGWKREEIVASIHKLLALDPESLLSFDSSKVEHLRQMVARNPELVQHQQVTTR